MTLILCVLAVVRRMPGMINVLGTVFIRDSYLENLNQEKSSILTSYFYCNSFPFLITELPRHVLQFPILTRKCKRRPGISVTVQIALSGQPNLLYLSQCYSFAK